MKTEDQKWISNHLKNELLHIDDLWNEKTDNHAYIIGYLIGMVKGVIKELDGDEEDSNNPT
jgi:hypothetical protein